MYTTVSGTCSGSLYYYYEEEEMYRMEANGQNRTKKKRLDYVTHKHTDRERAL